MTDSGAALRSLAEEALELAFADPARGGALAGQVAQRAQRAQDAAALSIASRAQAVAARDQQDLPSAAKHVRRALQVATRNDLTDLAGAALTTSVSILYLQGRPSAALQAADRAATLVTGPDLALLEMQRANI